MKKWGNAPGALQGALWPPLSLGEPHTDPNTSSMHLPMIPRPSGGPTAVHRPRRTPMGHCEAKPKALRDVLHSLVLGLTTVSCGVHRLTRGHRGTEVSGGPLEHVLGTCVDRYEAPRGSDTVTERPGAPPEHFPTFYRNP